ncbi:TruB pseudouridine synthase family member 1 [Rhinolophus ferrumequinum]|uniref:TruB pseudouridine synthase family member 1 n=1 Tax=Rhinolophus ferrumequinum TaxID=59479 RepID=A0A7J7UZ06_RHIFE|nr:TruB pseudouridine synthase family member 1 [Rhinolophus ferrumequinum]
MAAVEAAVVPSSSLERDTAPVPRTAGTAAATAATSSATAAAAAVAAAARTGSEARVSKAAMATKLLSLSGVFAVHKPKGPTSAELLNRLKEKLLAEAGMPSPEWTKRKKQTLKIGHGGTLDSAAPLLTFQMLNVEEVFISEAWSVTLAKNSLPVPMCLS